MAEDGKDPPPMHQIDRTPEYEAFIDKLADYHVQRGTTLDPEPKLGQTHLDLYKIFNHIVANGGYDKVSDEKLAWRRMASELGIYASNEASAAFSLKEKFYKNLAAYEISTVHGKEPPPKDILEDATAKGAGLLTRTRENFRGAKRDSNIGLSESAAASGDDTPAKEKSAAAETPSTSIRVSRGLREAPPQRVIFQPDTGPGRAARSSTSGQNAQTHANASSSHAGASSTATPRHSAQSASSNLHVPPTPTPVAPAQRNHRGGASTSNLTQQSSLHGAGDLLNFDPKPPTTVIPLRPVPTPADNPAEFARSRMPMRPPVDPIRLALAEYTKGPNIYIRCLMALRSKLPSEVSYALYHLVRISFERGDRFRFDAFAGLAEALVEEALKVGSLFYHVKWELSWGPVPYQPLDLDVLYGEEPTYDILERIMVLEPRLVSEMVQPEYFVDALTLVNEAALTLRNMMMHPDNALFMRTFAPLRDLVCIILNLPVHESVVEMKNYALDIAEQLTPLITLRSDDPLYRTLLAQLRDSDDRGIILTSLRALARISMNLDATNQLGEVPPRVLVRITEWMLLTDDEMLDACLDFLYQYTAVVRNVDNLIRSVVPENLVAHLVRLLSHGAKKVHREIIINPEVGRGCKDGVASMPEDLLEELLGLDDLSRVNAWVKCFFEEDERSYVTQLLVWNTYQNMFSAALKSSGQPQITPADFIRASVQVYRSEAQVVTEPDQQKFIIKGIRARERPVGTTGREYQRCLWSTNPNYSEEKCGHWCSDPDSLWKHVVAKHLGLPGGPNGHPAPRREYTCRWGDCTKYPRPTELHSAIFGAHVRHHAINMWPPEPGPDARPDSKSAVAAAVAAAAARKSWTTPSKSITVTTEETMTVRDERNPKSEPLAAGIPLSSALVLRNIARNVSKTDAEEEMLKQSQLSGRLGGWNERLFRPLIPRLQELLVDNRALAPYVCSLLNLVYRDPEIASEIEDRFGSDE